MNYDKHIKMILDSMSNGYCNVVFDSCASMAVLAKKK